MNKDQYLKADGVEAFSVWLAQHLDDNTFATSYADRRTGSDKSFDSLFDAYEKYCWRYSEIPGFPHPPSSYDFDANVVALKHLRTKLLEALDREEDNDTAMRDSAIDVMTWGGVRPGNVAWLTNHHIGLKDLVAGVQGVLALQDTAEIPRDKLRFNSGMTKVYSLICHNFIIYDSRVAAALGWAVSKFCQETGRTTVPPELAFPWAPAKESKNQTNPKRRNPSIGKLEFPPLRSGILHATWNLKASWLLQDVLGRNPDGKFSHTENPLRALEAALFMIGYDLPSLSVSTSHTTKATSSSSQPASEIQDDSSIPHGDWTDSETLRRAVEFRYRLKEDGIEVIIKKRERRIHFPIPVIESTLVKLWKDFEDRPFPLSNSASDVRNKEAEPGLGTAYFSATNEKGNPPDASFLAVTLFEALGVIILAEAGSRRKLSWKLNKEKLQLEDKLSKPAFSSVYKAALDGVDAI